MIKIGADPEFEIFRDGGFVSASRILHGGTSAKLGTDGASSTGELRLAPGDVGVVARSLNLLIGSMTKKLNGYQVYAGSGKKVPVGGHIHFSGISSDSSLISALDKFIAIPLNSISDRHVREGRYGSLSEIRYQPHGWEYRSPCSWISHPVIAWGVIVVAWTLAKAYEAGRLGEITTEEELYQYTKILKPSYMAGNVKKFYKMIETIKAEGGTLEQIEVLQAWAKGRKPVSAPVREAPVQEAPAISVSEFTVPAHVTFRSTDEMLPDVAREYLRLVRGVARDYRSLAVVGAAKNRPADVYARNPSEVLHPVEGVVIVGWEFDTIGLGWNLRHDPRRAALVLFNMLKQEVVQ